MKAAVFAGLKGRSASVPLVFILLLSFVLNFTGTTWGLPNYLDWAADSIAPFKVLEAGYYRFSNGWFDTYPPLHYAVLALVNAPFLGYLKLAGEFKTPISTFPFGFEDPLFALSSVTLISRMVSVLMGVAVVFLVYLVTKELFEHRSGLFSALIIALCYPFVHYAHTANVDIPYLFWAMLAVYYYIQIFKNDEVKDYVLFATFATLSICTKDQAYGLFLLAPLPILWQRFVSPNSASAQKSLEDVLDRRYVFGVIVAVVVFALVQNLPFNFAGFVNHVSFITGPARDNYVSYSPGFRGRLELLRDTVLTLSSGMTPALFACSLLGAVYYAFTLPRRSLPVLFLAASYYLIFINVLSNMKPRFVLPIAIILAFFGGKLLAELWQTRRLQRAMRVFICLAFVYASFFPIQLIRLYTTESRYAAEQWIGERIGPGTVVETFAPLVNHKYYPRFPAGIKLQSSQLSAGTQWEPQQLDRVRLPNLSTGGEAPDYIVLSEEWYSRFMTAKSTDRAEGRVLNDLFQGRLGYNLVAEFKTRTFVDVSDLPVNPRILIFEKASLARQG